MIRLDKHVFIMVLKLLSLIGGGGGPFSQHTDLLIISDYGPLGLCVQAHVGKSTHFTCSFQADDPRSCSGMRLTGNPPSRQAPTHLPEATHMWVSTNSWLVVWVEQGVCISHMAEAGHIQVWELHLCEFA